MSRLSMQNGTGFYDAAVAHNFAPALATIKMKLTVYFDLLPVRVLLL